MPELTAKYQYQPSALNGYCEFKIPDLSHPSFGMVTISGRFPRIKARICRPEVDPKIISGLVPKYTKWVEECGIGPASFERAGNITTTVTAALQFTIYWNPTVAVDSAEFAFYVWLILFCYFFDDGLEDGWFAGRLKVKTVQYVNETYVKIIRMQQVEDPLPEIEGLPAFHGTCKALRRMVAAGVDFVGEKYTEYIEPLAYTFQATFLSNDWYTCCRLDKRFSLRTYNAWRQWNGAGDGCLEGMLFLRGIRISQNVRQHPLFKRIMSIVRSNIAWVNDIFSTVKDLSTPNHPDNEILFRALEKGENIHDVVAETCVSIGEELQDLIYLKQALVDIFGEDENICGFLEMVDVIIDASLVIYMECNRYQCDRGYIRIFRDDDKKERHD